MDERQTRLEKKLMNLRRASMWSGVLGIVTVLVAAAQIVTTSLVSYVLIRDNDLSYYFNTAWPELRDVYSWAFFLLLGAWWLRRIRDAFGAMVDVIHELAETV